jgi:DNA-binding XRE family transcriptional regulator
MPKSKNTKIGLTPEQRAAHRAIHERMRDDRPGPDELIDRGDIDEPVALGQFVELMAVVKDLKRHREERGLSLTDVSEKSGLTRAMISRLENGWNNNPTLLTLYQYAQALGMSIKMTAVADDQEA